MFRALRQALEDQRAQIAERLEAVVVVEAALARMAAVFGIEAPPEFEAAPARRTGRAIITCPEAASPVLAPAAGAQQPCEHCGEMFSYLPHGGKPRLYCSQRCRQRACTARRRQGKPNGGTRTWTPGDIAEPEPVREWQRPLFVPRDHDEADPDREAALRPPALPWEAGGKS